jgi:serine/threonine protein phosphatase PrpC
MMGVCDGHGGVGHLVSNFVKINLPKILANYIQKKPGSDNSPPKVKKASKSFLPSIGGKTVQDINDSDSDKSGTGSPINNEN